MSTKIPLGIFWDIENCAIPSNKSVSSCVKQIRDFIADKRQLCGFAKEFCCACDVFNLGKSLSEGLDKNGVNVVHVNNTAKNAAEDKLQELIDMFIDKYGGTGSAVLCIISSDINLAKQIRNARRKDLDVILIHGINCSVDLKNLANDYHLYEDIIEKADNANETEGQIRPAYLEISNLPIDKHFEAIKKRLTDLSANCGGKPERIANGKGFIRFCGLEDAQRCLPRINGKDVYGSKILVNFCNKPAKGQVAQSNDGFTGSKQKNRSLNKSRIDLTHTSSLAKSRVPDEHMSVIKGMFTLSGSDYTEVIRNLVRNWNNPFIKPEFIIDVQRHHKYREGDGKHTLFVEAVDGQSCSALVKGAQTYMSSMEGIDWKPYNQSNEQKITDPPSDRKSIIIGLYTIWGQNVTEVVKSLVSEWKDIKILHTFIERVDRDRKFNGNDGCAKLIVTATSAENRKALVSGAQKYLSGNGIKWFHSKPSVTKDRTVGSPLKTTRTRADNKTNRKSDEIFETKTDQNLDKTQSLMKSEQTLNEKLIPKTTELTDKPKTEFEIRPEMSTKPKTTVIVRPMLTSDSTEDFEILTLDSKSQQSIPCIPRPIPIIGRHIPEPIPRGVYSEETNIFQTLITGIEGLFKPKTSYDRPEYPAIPLPNTDLIRNPTVPINYLIGDRMKSGLIIHFSGRINTGPHEGFTIEFGVDSGVAFHFDVRLTQLLVVRNTRAYGNWGPEEREYESFPFALGQDFNAMIRIDDKKYMVYITGQHFCDYKHRIPLNRVNNFSIFGDITIHWLRFAQN